MPTINLKRIFCVFDFSEENTLALTFASSLAEYFSAHLHIVQVIENYSTSAGFMVAGVPTYHNIYFDNAYDKSYLETVQNTLVALIPENIPFTIHRICGFRVQNILDLLREYNSDLCIIGMKSKSTAWKHFCAHSVIHRIMSIAPCPILTLNAFSMQGDYYARSN